jgi:hydroxymethylbilane synthase
MAGLTRLGISRPDIHPIAVDLMIPAVGQGALGVQCRADDPRVGPILANIDHAPTRAAVTGERAFLEKFGGGCNVPAGCHVTATPGGFAVRAVVADDAGRIRRFEAEGTDPVALGEAAAAALS